MTEKLLLEIIVVMLGVLVLMAGFIWHSHDRQHDTMQKEMARLRNQRDHCAESFASKEAVARAHDRLDAHDDDIVDLRTSVTRLEAYGGKS